MTRLLISVPRSEDDLAAARTLFGEYVSAPDWEASFATYLARQAFDRELATLSAVYAPPAGRLLLARAGEVPAGCVAMKALEPPSVCEMKRLYVRPRYRALGLGRQLVEAISREAAAAGYTRMRLDTLPSMQAAQRLYRNLGFTEIPAYCENPVPGALFLERELVSAGLPTAVTPAAEPSRAASPRTAGARARA